MIRNPQLILKQSSDISEDILRSLIDDILQMDKTQVLAPQKAPIKASGNELQDLRDQIANLTKIIEDKKAPVLDPVIATQPNTAPTYSEEFPKPEGEDPLGAESAVEAEDKADEIVSDPAPELTYLSKDKSE